MNKVTVELDHIELRNIYSGVLRQLLFVNQEVVRARRRGFKEHQAAELISWQVSLEHLRDKLKELQS